jgi:hypothetical protein
LYFTSWRFVIASPFAIVEKAAPSSALWFPGGPTDLNYREIPGAPIAQRGEQVRA